MKPTDLSMHLTTFMTEYLPLQKNVSRNTILSYRDTFKLLLQYIESEEAIPIEKVTLQTLSAECIVRYLNWLEEYRHCSACTRNLRLAALKSFFRYVQGEVPESLYNLQKVLAIPIKKTRRKIIAHLSVDEIKTLLRQPITESIQGRRDLTLLSLMYDSGARVQEIADLRVKDLVLTPQPVLTILGKGSKIRRVPIMQNTAKLLEGYIHEHRLNLPFKADYPLFTNRQHNKLTKEGISYIVSKYANEARKSNPSFPRVRCHMLRHSKAVHLLQANVNLIYIRDFLGHSDVKTTEVYARADTELKRKALENAYPNLIDTDLPDWTKNGQLMDWLNKI